MWIEIFRSGEHTDSAGVKELYTPEMLDRISEIYNTKIDNEPAAEAPVVKGHPADDDPAYGWVERLARRGDKLLAKVKDLSPDFVNEVKSGLYKKISMAIYPDMLLRHVGFLGAVPPAVKGLKPVCFNNSEEFMNYESEGSIFCEESEVENIDGLKSSVTEPEDQSPELKRQNEELTEKIKLLEANARAKEFREFANSLIENPAGMLITPAQADNLVAILEIVHSASSGEFAETSENVGKVESFFSSLSPVFSTNEFASRGTKGNIPGGSDFTGKNVQTDKLKLHERALEIQAESAGMTYEEAVAAARKEY